MQAAAVEAPASNQFQQPSGKGLGFYTGEDGYLYCDNMRVEDIRQQVRRSKLAQDTRCYSINKLCAPLQRALQRTPDAAGCSPCCMHAVADGPNASSSGQRG